MDRLLGELIMYAPVVDLLQCIRIKHYESWLAVDKFIVITINQQLSILDHPVFCDVFASSLKLLLCTKSCTPTAARRDGFTRPYIIMIIIIIDLYFV